MSFVINVLYCCDSAHSDSMTIGAHSHPTPARCQAPPPKPLKQNRTHAWLIGTDTRCWFHS